KVGSVVKIAVDVAKLCDEGVKVGEKLKGEFTHTFEQIKGAGFDLVANAESVEKGFAGLEADCQELLGLPGKLKALDYGALTSEKAKIVEVLGKFEEGAKTFIGYVKQVSAVLHVVVEAVKLGNEAKEHIEHKVKGEIEGIIHEAEHFDVQ